MEPYYKAKIFFYDGTVSDSHADTKFNDWVKNHDDANIIEFRYQYYGNCHSIAILYSEGCYD